LEELVGAGDLNARPPGYRIEFLRTTAGSHREPTAYTEDSQPGR